MVVTWYMGIELLKVFIFEDNLLKRLPTDRNDCLMMERGWFDCLCKDFISLFVLLTAR